MATVSGSVPNLIGGVSQQPPEIRALNTSTSLVNSWSSVVSGLGTRSGTEFIGDVGAVPAGSTTAATHGIAKPSGRYAVSVVGGELFVTDVRTGLPQTVVYEGGSDAYLECADPATCIRFTTIGDTTFILNRTKVTSKTTAPETGMDGNTENSVVRKNPNLLATHWVRQSAGYAAYYNLYLNGTQIAQAFTGAGPDGIATDIRADLTDAGYPFSVVDDTLTSFIFADEEDYLTATDTFGNQATLVYNDFVTEFTDLPDIDVDGRMVLVKQDAEEDADDYWVWRYKGSWEETYGWNAGEEIDAETMPVILVDNLDGTWTLKQSDWKGRTVGDEESNPTPSFIGKTINDMFRYKGRLVFLSDENVVMSQKGELGNFYRTTCAQLIDEDRIDIAASESRGATLVGARPFDGGLLVFSDTDQFILKGDQDGLISPNTADMDLVNTYTASPDLQPVGVGPNVVFVDETPSNSSSFSQLREYRIERVFGQQVATSITDQVPEYIPTGVFRMLSATSQSAVVIATSGAPRSLFCYNYYYNNDGKVQSSWQRWDYEFDILNAALIDDELFILSQSGSRLLMLRQRFSGGVSPLLTEEDVLLDKRVSSEDLTVTYTEPSSTLTLPYPIDTLEDIVLVIAPGNSGSKVVGQLFNPDPVASSGSTLVFRNVDLTGEDFFIGYTFAFEWELSPLFLRDQNMVVVQDGRLQLSRISVLFNKSGPFTAEVTPPGRDPAYKQFTGFVIGSQTDRTAEAGLDDGKFRFSAPGQSDLVGVKITGRTPWRVRFSSLEWEGKHRPRTKRTM
jgi:hypothetical protein